MVNIVVIFFFFAETNVVLHVQILAWISVLCIFQSHTLMLFPSPTPGTLWITHLKQDPGTMDTQQPPN